MSDERRPGEVENNLISKVFRRSDKTESQMMGQLCNNPPNLFHSGEYAYLNHQLSLPGIWSADLSFIYGFSGLAHLQNVQKHLQTMQLQRDI